jgi:hypothetical protein
MVNINLFERFYDVVTRRVQLKPLYSSFDELVVTLFSRDIS